MPPKIIMSITALNAALLLGTIYVHNGEQKQVQLATPVESSAIYDALTVAEKAEIDKAPSKLCTKDGVSILGNDREPTTGLWKCGDAIMGPVMQVALDKAAAKVPTGKLEGQAQVIE